MKGLAIAASAGIALSLTASPKRIRTQPPVGLPAVPSDDVHEEDYTVDLTPLLDRMDRQDAEIAALRNSLDEERARGLALERSLAEQTIGIGTLKQRAEEADVNMQRLIVAIEKLCERQIPPAAPAAPPPVAAPFQAQLDKAMGREERKPRIPMTRIF